MSPLRRLARHVVRRLAPSRGTRATGPTAAPDYPGDYSGEVGAPFAPGEDGLGPGAVVWAWVPYEEDHSRGKDRPVLVVGRDGRWLLTLPMTSQDHDRDEDQERRAGRHWIDVGAGSWDDRHRRSEARLDRVVRVDPGAVRRADGRVDEGVYAAVVRAYGAVRRGEPYDDDPA